VETLINGRLGRRISSLAVLVARLVSAVDLRLGLPATPRESFVVARGGGEEGGEARI
jgi:hypothetical protein